MFKRFDFSTAAVILFAFGSTSCGGGTVVPDAGVDLEVVCDTNTPATLLSKVMSDVLTPACVSCHAAGMTGEAYGVYSTAATTLAQVGKKSLFAGTDASLKAVDANNLATSTMWLKVLPRDKGPSGKSIGTPMPQGGPALSAPQKKILKDWICSGAKM